MEAVFERIAKDWGSSTSCALHRVLAQGRSCRARRRRVARRLSGHHGRVVLDLHPHGASRRAADEEGRHLFTMTYYGSQMVVKNYNIMGVAKAALEGAVRYSGRARRRASACMPSRPGRWRRVPPPASRNSTTCSTRRRPRRPRAASSASRTLASATAFSRPRRGPPHLPGRRSISTAGTTSSIGRGCS